MERRRRGRSEGPLLTALRACQDGFPQVQGRRLERHLCPGKEVVCVGPYCIDDRGSAGCVECIPDIDLEDYPASLAGIGGEDGLEGQGHLLAHGVARQARLHREERAAEFFSRGQGEGHFLDDVTELKVLRRPKLPNILPIFFFKIDAYILFNLEGFSIVVSQFATTTSFLVYYDMFKIILLSLQKNK